MLQVRNLVICISIYNTVCFLFVCQQDNSKSCRRVSIKCFGVIGRVTSNSWLEFSDDPTHDADAGISWSNFSHCQLFEFYW